MSRPFRFKRFGITQEKAAMKVGTDGVLLGAWAGLTHICGTTDSPLRILDIGTGTGLIALMMAQRTEDQCALTDAVEIDEGAYAEALHNVAKSPWPDRIKVFHNSIQEFCYGAHKGKNDRHEAAYCKEGGNTCDTETEGYLGNQSDNRPDDKSCNEDRDDCINAERTLSQKSRDSKAESGDENCAGIGVQGQNESFQGDKRGVYDIIVSNPPFFAGSLKAPEQSRSLARHTSHLTFNELLGCVSVLLKPHGVFSVILPHLQADGFISEAKRHFLEPARRTEVLPTPGSPPKRTLLQFVKHGRADIAATGFMVIESEGRHQYSREYRALTKDFYLKL